MGELDTYALADLVPFGPEAYARLFAQHNRDLFPAPVVGFAVGSIALWAAWRGRGRLLAGLLAAAWVWIGRAWFAGSYATLNWAGEYMAYMAYANAILMACMAFMPSRWPRDAMPPTPARRRVGLGLACIGVMAYPMFAPMSGRPWAGIEVFGHAPEPTAVATLGLVLAVGRWPAAGMAIPTAVCALGGATAWVLGDGGGWSSSALALAAWGALPATRRNRG